MEGPCIAVLYEPYFPLPEIELPNINTYTCYKAYEHNYENIVFGKTMQNGYNRLIFGKLCFSTSTTHYVDGILMTSELGYHFHITS